MTKLLAPSSSSKPMFTTMSTLMPRAGTWNRFRWYSHLIVMSSRAIP